MKKKVQKNITEIFTSFGAFGEKMFGFYLLSSILI